MADEALVEQVLRAVELIPPGRVVAYGDIAALVGIGPRHVGNVLARWGSDVPWWRVTNRLGELPPQLLVEAHGRWDAEGITQKPDGSGCRLREHQADLSELATRWEQATSDIRR